MALVPFFVATSFSSPGDAEPAEFEEVLPVEPLTAREGCFMGEIE